MLNERELNYILTRHGWCDKAKAEKLYELTSEIATQERPCVVELGVFAGRSLFPMALALKRFGRGRIYAVETWDNITPLEGKNSTENNEWWSNVNMEFIKNEFYKSVNFLSLGDYVEVIKTKSYDAAIRFADQEISMLHQDSAHNEEVITKELEAWTPKIKLNGYWIVDDINWNETKSGYAKLPSFGFELVQEYETWAVYKKTK